MLKRKGYFDFRVIKSDISHTLVKIQTKIEDRGFVEDLRIIIYQFDSLIKQANLQYDGKEGDCSVYSAEITLGKAGIYWFYFSLLIEGMKYYVYRDEEYLVQQETKKYPNEAFWKLEIKDSNLKEYPEWYKRRIYQIMPDRFAIGSKGIISTKRKIKNWHDRMPDWQPDSDGVYRNEYFYGGNLEGIKEKLPYIRELGFNAIYINPIFKSKNYHHYDTEDFFCIDELLGDLEELEMLCIEAKKLDIKVILDIAFNHTSDEHKYFKSAISDENSPYREYYLFDNGKPVCWYGYSNMPELNKLSPKVQNECIQILKKYINAGVDAFRLDLGDILPREFLLKVVKGIQQEYPHIIFINEMWDIATIRKNAQIFDGQTNSVMNYPLRDAIIRWVRWGHYEHFLYNFKKVYGEYPKSVINNLMNVISTHDTVTLMTALVGEIMNSDPYLKLDDIEGRWRFTNSFDTFGFRKYSAENDKLSEEQKVLAQKRVKLALPIFYTILGNPSMFQGTENSETGYKDPFCRKPMDWENVNVDMNIFVKNLNIYAKENSDILGNAETRIREIDRQKLVLEVFTEKGSIILIANNQNQEMVNDKFLDYDIVFTNNNSTKDKICEYGVIILRKNILSTF